MIAPRRGRLFQEDLASEPFWMLVACVLVNRASWEVAEGALLRLRYLWRRPVGLLNAHLVDVENALRPLGFQRVRATRLRALAAAWLSAPPRTRDDVLRLPGCGPYAGDAWALFVEGRTDVTPSDGKLLWWLLEGRHDRAQQRRRRRLPLRHAGPARRGGP